MENNYWIFHDIETNRIYFETADKTWEGCYSKLNWLDNELAIAFATDDENQTPFRISQFQLTVM